MKTLEKKLRFACDARAADGYEFVQAHPDAADMFDLGFKSVCAGYDKFGALLAALLDAPAEAVKPRSVAGRRRARHRLRHARIQGRRDERRRPAVGRETEAHRHRQQQAKRGQRVGHGLPPDRGAR